MHEFGDRGQPEVGEPSAHEVLDGLHIVASRGLECGQLGDLRLTELGGEVAQLAFLLGFQGRRAEHSACGEKDQPLHLDAHAGTVEARLREVLSEFSDGTAVPPIEGAEGLRGQRAHVTPCRRTGSSCRKRATLALSMVDSTESNRAASE